MTRRSLSFRLFGRTSASALALLVSLTLLFGLTGSGVFAQDVSGFARTQTIALKKGWNAVHLEVEPLEANPALLFAGTPVDIAAAYFARTSSSQFVSDPGTNLFRELGWGVWYSEDRPDAFLKTLHAILGGQGYLIHATADHNWSVKGIAVREKQKWMPDAFNFVGFPVVDQGGPTFAQFFAGSKAHRDQPIYRLSGDSWKKVTQPAAETMRSGEAFWIFCSGSSNYPGPLGVETQVESGLYLSGREDSLILRNRSDQPLEPTIQHVAASGLPNPLSIVIEVVGGPGKPFHSVAATKPGGNWEQSLPSLEPGRAIAVPFAPVLEAMTAVEHLSLLKVETDLGTIHWIPVTNRRDDFEE